MDKYDPLRAPDPKLWLDLDEHERIHLVVDYHRRTQFKQANVEMHSLMHVLVENQIALGDEIPVRRTAQRLIVEGLDRHDVIHAIASVLASHMTVLMTNADAMQNPHQPYYDALEELTADEWLTSGI